MTCRTSKKNPLLAALFTFSLLLLAASSASAQQVTYYDFNTPQANPSQYTYACTPGSATNPLFCLNDGTGTSSNPSFFLDAYPASIDPILSDNPAQPGSYYATQMTNAYGQESSLWFSVPQVVANGFTTWFAFKLTPNANSYATADGLAFVIQNSQGSNALYDSNAGCTGIGGAGPTALGTGGGCMGYGGIDNSLALEFDTYYNSWDPNDNNPNNPNDDNHIALQNCGAGLPNSPDHYSFVAPSEQTVSCQVNLGPANAPVPTLVSNPQSSTPGVGTVTLADGNVHQVVVNYSGPLEAKPNLLQVFIDPPFNPGTHTPAATAVPVISGTYDITTALNLINSGSANDSAYIGFTSGTGAAFEENELMAWTYTPHTTVTQAQPLQPAGSPTYQPFPFGTHTYGVQYPADGPPTTGISMTVTASTVSPALFAQLIAGTPFQGSVCQVYDDTGGNCVIYSVSCSVTGSNPVQVVACPAVTVVPNCIGSNASSCINVKTTYNSSETPVTPGFIQGDPFFSQISTLTVSADTANFTCTGECAVTLGQTVTVVGASPAGFNGSYTVTNITAPNQFTAQTALSASGTATTGGYLTSSNTQNIFTSWTAANIDGTTKGTTNQFSDFVFTSQTTNANTQTLLAANSNSPTVGQSDLLTATITAFTGTPTGSVLFYAGSNLICTSPVSTVLGITTATCSYTPTSSTPVLLTAQYQGDPSHLLSNSNQLSFTPTAATPTITFNPAPGTQTYGTPITAGSLDAAASFDNSAIQGTFAYTTTINSVANQPVTPGVTVLPVGNYTITATFTPGSSSYTSASTTAPYSVTQATPSVTWPTAGAITYGQTLATSILTGGSASLNNTNVPGTFAFTTPTATPNAGLQSEGITFTPNTPASYSSVTSAINIQVNPAPLTVTPNPAAATMTYGGPLPTLTPSYSGFVTGTVPVPVAPTCTATGVTTTSAIGNYPTAATCSGGTAPTNYAFTYVPGSVTVNKANLNVTPNPTAATMTYGGTTPTITPSYSGYVNGTVAVPTAPTCTSGVTSTTPAGSYPTSSSCSGGVAPANYAFNYLTGSVTVSKATLTVTPSPNPATMPYGGPLPVVTPGYTGFVNGVVTPPVAPTCTIAGITTTTVAGNYPTASSCSGGTAPTNYTFAYNTGAVTVTAAPMVSVSPSSLNFGTAIYQGSILAKTVTITNTGDATLTFSSDPFIALLGGGDSSEFATVNLCPKTLAAGKSCTMVVGFVAGPYYTLQTAVLKITDNAAGSPQLVPVSATVIDPVASFSANTLSFGTVKANSATLTKSITLSNPGGTALSITGFAITGADKGDYSETTTCTATLAAKATPCTISVTFKPTAKGSRTATLIVTDNAQNSPQSISLSGTGD